MYVVMFMAPEFLLIVLQLPDVKSLQHRREINKKTRSGAKKLEKQIKSVKSVRVPPLLLPAAYSHHL